jgi:RNA polymerase sigma-70 factor (ECF subfamily)
MSDEIPAPPIVESSPHVRAPTGPDGTVDPEQLTAWVSEQYRDRLRLFAARRLRDRAMAEDVVQETLKTMLVALRAGRIREPAAIAGFAFETVRNLCLHRGRSDQREGKALERLAVSLPPEPDDVLTTVISEERRRAVRAALDRLNEEDRRLLLMTYVDARSSEDIGGELGLSPGAVRVRRHRALQRLRAHLRSHVTIAPDRE